MGNANQSNQDPNGTRAAGPKYSQFDIHVAHYTPSTFPMRPHVNKRTMRVCKDSWMKILEPVTRDGITISGMTAFYTEFYDSLDLLDKLGKFEAVLRKHSAGMNSIAAKGAILIRIMNYALALDPDSENTAAMLYALGKSHNQKRIRPWQYTIFIQCLMTTLSSRLGASATNEVMSCWVNLFAFILKAILPVAIKGLVNVNELEVNVVLSEAEKRELSGKLRNRI